MKNTIERLIAVAARAGSSATTPAGAIRYLRAHGLPQSETPIYRVDPDTARQQRCQRYLSARLNWQYRQSQSRWAGGEHSISWDINDTPSARCTTTRVWSPNGRWSGTNSHAHIVITQQAINLLGTDNLYIGGLLTLDAERMAPRVYRAAWVVQFSGVSVRVAYGHIVRGYHVETLDLDTALRTAARARKKSLVQALKRRAARQTQQREDAALQHVWVSMDDSIRAGNFSSGTSQARSQLTALLHANGEIGAVRADVALKSLPGQSVYINRAILAARQRG